MRKILATLSSTAILLAYLHMVQTQDINTNGCGSGKFIINNGLNEAGEAVLIECCNKHDICYGKSSFINGKFSIFFKVKKISLLIKGLCNGQKECDDQFDKCLTKMCDSFSSFKKKMCLWDKTGMVMAVRTFGFKFYCKKDRD
jgi:hypothetical protein